VLAQKCHQFAETGGAGPDAKFCYPSAAVVDQRNVMMGFGPVDATCDAQSLAPLFNGEAEIRARDLRGDLMGALRGATPHQPVASPAACS
jgi:hypothetical protein